MEAVATTQQCLLVLVVLFKLQEAHGTFLLLLFLGSG
jgi:hypothetical protein